MTDCVNFHEFKGFDQYGLYDKNQENILPLQLLIFEKVNVFLLCLLALITLFQPLIGYVCI